MFETSVIHAEVVAEKRVGLLSASFAFHALVVIAILANGIRTIEFPTSAPREYTMPVFALPSQVPPALGVPNGGHKQSTPPAPVKPTTPAANTGAEHRARSHRAGGVGGDYDRRYRSDQQRHRLRSAAGRALGRASRRRRRWSAFDARRLPREPDVPLRVGGDVKAPVVIRRVQPVYPKLAITARMNGPSSSNASSTRPAACVKRMCCRSTSPLFNQSAIDAVQQWQFAPGSLHGTAIDTIFDLTVTFRVTS